MKQKGLMKKSSVVLLATTMTVSTFSQFIIPVFAANTPNGTTYDAPLENTSLIIEGGIKDQDYTYENGIITFLKDGDYTVIGDGSFTSDRIIVADNVTGSLTLRNVRINTQATSCLEVKGTANLTIWLEGENTLRVNEHDPAALQFENVTTGSLVIDSKSNGILNAIGWNGAGIGGSMTGAPKNLTFRGGIIHATSYRSATGIGKGWYSTEDSEITIEGGIIYSDSVWEANKGLGGTENSLITIKGGYVDCGVTGNVVISGGYIAGEISGTVTNTTGLELNKVDVPLLMDNVKEIWIDDINQNINYTFSDKTLQVYLTPSNHKVKLVDKNGNEKIYYINANGKIDGNIFIDLPTNLSATYTEKLKLSDIDLSTTGWTWLNEDTDLLAGTNSYPATFDTTNLESMTDFSNVEGYNKDTHKVTRNIEVKVAKADSQVNITTKSLDKVYDGNAVKSPEYTTLGSDGEVTITWQKNTGTANSPKWEDLKNAPSTAGNYRAVVELAENNNYHSASASLEFVISQTQNSWTEELSIKGWVYNEQVNKPSAKAQFGDVTFVYSDKENGAYTDIVPKNAGTYYVKAIVTETDDYVGLESAPVSFEIAKAVPTYEDVTGLVIEQGQPLSKIELPKQFKWVDETIIVDELGTHTFKAIYTPEDTANYQTIEVEIEVTVKDTSDDTDKPDTDKPSTDHSNNEKDKDSVDTGDQTNTGLYTSMFTISALGIAVLAVLKKKKVLDNK